MIKGTLIIQIVIDAIDIQEEIEFTSFTKAAFDLKMRILICVSILAELIEKSIANG